MRRWFGVNKVWVRELGVRRFMGWRLCDGKVYGLEILGLEAVWVGEFLGHFAIDFVMIFGGVSCMCVLGLCWCIVCVVCVCICCVGRVCCVACGVCVM